MTMKSPYTVFFSHISVLSFVPGLFSYMFLGKRYSLAQLTGLFLVVIGLVVVGISSLISGVDNMQVSIKTGCKVLLKRVVWYFEEGIRYL